MNKYLVAIISILIAQSAGIIVSVFTASSDRAWYVDLVKPEWNPPSWLFGPAWIILYTLMGIAAYLIWQNRGVSGAKIGLYVYGGHLVLNALWSILFFGLKNPGLAFAEIIVLLISILAVTILFWKIRPWAGALMIPYIVWTLFAASLNYAIWILN